MTLNKETKPKTIASQFKWTIIKTARDDISDVKSMIDIKKNKRPTLI